MSATRRGATFSNVRLGLLRVRYWALEADGRRAELLATVEQDARGGYAGVLCADPRSVEGVLEMSAEGSWREVRKLMVPASDVPRILPTP